MRLAIILIVVGGVVLLALRYLRGNNTGGKFWVDGEGNLRDSGGGIVNGAAPPNVAADPRLAVNAPGGNSLSDYCRKVYGYNAQLIGMVPDKNATKVAAGNNLLADVNCGTLKYAEKYVANPVKNFFKSIF